MFIDPVSMHGDRADSLMRDFAETLMEVTRLEGDGFHRLPGARLECFVHIGSLDRERRGCLFRDRSELLLQSLAVLLQLRLQMNLIIFDESR